MIPMKLPALACGVLASVLTLAPARAQSNASAIPHLEERDGMTKLIVDGRPFICVAGELTNTASSDREGTKAAIAREESRGAHFKITDEMETRHDIPLDDRALKRDDEHWLKTTLATYQDGQAVIAYEPVDISLASPVKRDYGKTTTK